MRFLSLASLVLAISLLATTGCTRGPAKPKVAVVTNNAYQFWQFCKNGAETAGKDFGVDVEVKMPRGGAEDQVQICEDLLVRGTKGIAISANDAANMASFFEKKIAPKVPLLTIDSDVPDAKIRRAYIGTNNYLAGRAAGDLIKKAIPDGGNVVIFVGKMDAQNAIERRQGVLDVLAEINSQELKQKTPAGAHELKLGKYTLVDTKTDDAKSEECLSQAEDLFTKRKDIDAVVGLWEYNPPALLRAKKNLQAKTAVIGFDENDESLNAIRDGSLRRHDRAESVQVRLRERQDHGGAGEERRLGPQGLSRHRRRASHLHPASRDHEGRSRRVPGPVQEAAREVSERCLCVTWHAHGVAWECRDVAFLRIVETDGPRMPTQSRGHATQIESFERDTCPLFSKHVTSARHSPASRRSRT